MRILFRHLRQVAFLLPVILIQASSAYAYRKADVLHPDDTYPPAEITQRVGRITYHGQSFCAGTLIATDLVLTAGHCLDDFQDGFEFLNQYPQGWTSSVDPLGFEIQTKEGLLRYKVIGGLVHKEVPTGKRRKHRRDAVDLAGLRVKAVGKVPAGTQSALEETLKLNSEGLDRGDWAVGVSVTHDKRSKKIASDSFSYGEFKIKKEKTFGKKGSTLFIHAKARKFKVCGGDSGSPLFQEEHGQFKIIGVLAGSVKRPFAKCSRNTRFTSVSPHRAWIQNLDQAIVPGRKSSPQVNDSSRTSTNAHVSKIKRIRFRELRN